MGGTGSTGKGRTGGREVKGERTGDVVAVGGGGEGEEGRGGG
ncbi:hypothetical protein E2C01_062515 [Portunus trituberculatus]|uniref:Uncharacterized protein n=1 Tax=Portunus trituberculatus TaxID=210409 RepID=A0A5B7HE93_PORTR|nr:hypothetical protein [Portunus trituberculatus]